MFDLANWGRGKRLAVKPRGRKPAASLSKRAMADALAMLEDRRKELKKFLLNNACTPSPEKDTWTEEATGDLVFMVPRKKTLNLKEPWSAFDSRDSFVESLKRKGFKLIGSGAYSRVLYKKGDRVIKVGRADQWINYVLWAGRTGYGGSFAPKVFSYKKFKGKATKTAYNPGGPFYVAVMEKLEKTLHDVHTREDMALAPHLFQAHVYKNQAAGKMLDLLTPGLSTFSKEFAKVFKRGHDLHRGNFMLRSNGGLVLTDPITHADVVIKQTRLRSKDLSPANDNIKVQLAA